MTAFPHLMVCDQLIDLHAGATSLFIFTPIPDDWDKSRLDSLGSWPDDLCVLQMEIFGEVGLLEFFNQVVAQRFDLSDRHIRVHPLHEEANFLQCKGQAVNSAGRILLFVDVIHSVISRSRWGECGANAAANAACMEAAFPETLSTPETESAA